MFKLACLLVALAAVANCAPFGMGWGGLGWGHGVAHNGFGHGFAGYGHGLNAQDYAFQRPLGGVGPLAGGFGGYGLGAYGAYGAGHPAAAGYGYGAGAPFGGYWRK